MQKREKILIIKAGYSEFLEGHTDSRKVSFGDVLRATPILHLFKGDSVTWLTDEKAFPLLEGNLFIERLLRLDWITISQLKEERFDTIINLEKIPGISAIADDIYAVRRFGFRFDPELGESKAYDKAYDVLAICSDPEIKKENKKTAQELLFELAGQIWKGEEYILGYKPKTQEIYDIALNTQVGQKWPTKTWSKENWDKLQSLLIQKGFKVTRQDEQGPKVLENLYGYMDWINSSKLIISCDSLGMHLGIALRKKVLGLFGSTPHTEVYFYNNGKAIIPEQYPNCAPCFKGDCERGKKCIEEITPEKVLEEIQGMFPKLEPIQETKTSALDRL